MSTRLRRVIACTLIVCVGGIALPAPALAGMMATESILADAPRDRVAAQLARQDVGAQLQAHGVDPAELDARIAALSDAEVAQLAGELDSLPAGGNGIIGAALIVFLVLLLTDIMGFTKVFSFTKPAR